MVRILRQRRAGGSATERNRPPQVGSGRWAVHRTVARPSGTSHVGRNTNFTAQTSNSLNYYPAVDGLTTTYHQVGGTVVHRLGRRYTVHASPFASYSPSYSMRLFLAPLPVDPGGAGSLDGPPLAAPDVDSTILQRASFRYGGNAELKMVVARYSTLTVGYRYTKTDLSNELGDYLNRSGRRC